MSNIEIKVPEDNQEGTTMKIQKWLKSIGDVVKKDEPLVEIETDKVTIEIEAPDDGILAEMHIEPGQDVVPGTIIGTLSPQGEEGEKKKNKASPIAVPSKKTAKASNVVHSQIRLSPAVRRYVTEHRLATDNLTGTGKGGRLTLSDVKKLREAPAKVIPLRDAQNIAPVMSPVDQMIPHSNMRLAIAKHMSHSVGTAPHVTAIFELDFTAIAAHRAAHKAAFAAQGVKLSYTAYFILACVEAMKAVPAVNSQWFEDKLHIFGDVNIGIGTSLGNQGLVVPVIKQAQTKNLLGIAQSLQDVIDRARDNKLKPADVKGGTFTISNHGVSGSLVASPIIINQPQSAILGVGKLEKRVVVKTIAGQDVMAIKPMAFVSLTIDHRVLDGHQTNQWLSCFVQTLENWGESHA